MSSAEAVAQPAETGAMAPDESQAIKLLGFDSLSDELIVYILSFCEPQDLVCGRAFLRSRILKIAPSLAKSNSIGHVTREGGQQKSADLTLRLTGLLAVRNAQNRLSHVSRRFSSICHDDSVWRAAFETRFGHSELPLAW